MFGLTDETTNQIFATLLECTTLGTLGTLNEYTTLSDDQALFFGIVCNALYMNSNHVALVTSSPVLKVQIEFYRRSH